MKSRFAISLAIILALLCHFTIPANAKTLANQASQGMPPLSDQELLDTLEARAANYFMEKIIPGNGFVYDVSNNTTYSSVGATGFGLAVLPIIAARSGTSAPWVYTSAQARARAELILDNLLLIQQMQAGQETLYGQSGFFYHFLNTSLQRRNVQTELSLIDTTLILAGALTAGNYFGGTVKQKAEQVFDNVDWSFFFDTGLNQFHTGFTPEFGFNGVTFDRYSDEGLLVSLLALRAHPGDRDYEESLFNYPRYKGTYGPYTLVHSYYGSLFTYVMGHAFYDFKTLGYDRPFGVLSSVTPVDWWQNSRDASKANRLFCIDKSSQFSSYGPQSWGLSATIRPNGSYFGDNGARPADSGNGNAVFDGTVPTATGIAAMPFFKDEDGGVLGQNQAFQMARHLYDTYYQNLWGPYGFYASFNHLGQFSSVYLGIELGPLALMIENYRSNLIWNTFMNDPETSAPLADLFSYQSAAVPTGNDFTRECEQWTSKNGGALDFKPHASGGLTLGAGWGKLSSHFASYAVDVLASNNLVFSLRYASDAGGGWVDVYLDNELRGSFYAAQTCPVDNTCGWDTFLWGNSVQIGAATAGTHTVKLVTRGTPNGLNIDIFKIRDSTLTPPAIAFISPADGSGFIQGGAGALEVSASDPDGDPVQYQYLVNDEIVKLWSDESTFDFSAHLTDPGIIRVRVQVRDGFGGVNEALAEYAAFRQPLYPPQNTDGGGGGGGGNCVKGEAYSRSVSNVRHYALADDCMENA